MGRSTRSMTRHEDERRMITRRCSGETLDVKIVGWTGEGKSESIGGMHRQSDTIDSAGSNKQARAGDHHIYAHCVRTRVCKHYYTTQADLQGRYHYHKRILPKVQFLNRIYNYLLESSYSNPSALEIHIHIPIHLTIIHFYTCIPTG
jgi:hypothetical protein